MHDLLPCLFCADHTSVLQGMLSRSAHPLSLLAMCAFWLCLSLLLTLSFPGLVCVPGLSPCVLACLLVGQSRRPGMRGLHVLLMLSRLGLLLQPVCCGLFVCSMRTMPSVGQQHREG